MKKNGCGSRIFVACLISVLTVCSSVVAAAGVESQGVRAILLPVSSVVENGQIILTAKLKFKNATNMPVSNIVATASAAEGVEVNPKSVSLAYLGGYSEAVAETQIIIKSPELKNQEKAKGGLVWQVDYSIPQSEIAKEPVSAMRSGDIATKDNSKIRQGIHLSEIMFCPSDPNVEAQWVELYNDSDSEDSNIVGYELCNSSGTVYTFPGTILPVPPAAFILVVFDGQDATKDDVSFDGDNLITLHVNNRNSFDEEGDICALFKGKSHTKDSMCGFVRWGNVPNDSKKKGNIYNFSDYAVKKGLWDKNTTPLIIKHSKKEKPKGPIQTIEPGGTLGIVNEPTRGDPQSWATYSKSQASPGAINPLPSPVLFLPENNTESSSGLFSFSWIPLKWAHHYQFQICSDRECAITVVNETNLMAPSFRPQTPFTVSEKYYWRVRAVDKNGTFSSWSEIRAFVIVGTPLKGNTSESGNDSEMDFLSKGAGNPLGVVALAARKDTSLLCLDGCERDATNNHHWDGTHEALAHWWDHEAWYCYAAAIAMMNHYYGGTITRDEVAWRIMATDASPELDLGHNDGVVDSETTFGLAWALDPSPMAPYDEASLHYSRSRPSDNDLKTWIDAGRPVMYSTPSHWMVVDGYRDVAGTLQAHFLNVDNDGGEDWRPFASHSFDSYYVPDLDVSVRNTDSGVSTDSDGDGIMDFDEDVRFHTDKNKADTDGDDVPDKADVASYVFRGIDADVDGDGLRGELDEDSDDGGIIDGLEDLDHDGKYELSEDETDPHNKADDLKLDLILCIDNTGSMGDDIAAVKVASTEIVNAVLAKADARIALVTYRDFPVDPYGCPEDWTFKDIVPFTNNPSALIAGINSMSAYCGLDWQESVYSALMHCIDSTSLGSWRGQPIKKAIIVMGDAPPHDPEPFTGYTMSSVINAAEDADPVIAYTIAIGGDSTTIAYFTGLADGTGGEVFTAANASEVVEAIMKAIEVIKYSPFAEAGGPYEGTQGEPIDLDASGSYDPDGNIVLYEWDWDSDGTYDYNTVNPICEHTWNTEFSGNIRLRVTDNDGLSSIDTADVTVLTIPNLSPVANAGSDQTVYAWIDGIADVNLDGSDSNDPDGDELTYSWTWMIDGNSYDANGAKPTIELPVGQYVISLIVNDGIVDSEPNDVNITVIGPVKANLCVVPKVLNCRSNLPRIMTTMRLPKGITKDQIDTDEPLLLYPGAIKADWKWIGRDYDYKCRAWRTTILAWFDKDDLMSAIDGNGKVELAVVGQLKTGQYFFGTDTVTVICPGHWPWHRHWFDHRWNR